MARVTPEYCHATWYDEKAEAEHPEYDHVCGNVKGHDSIKHGPCDFCGARER
jgi:hypothetical protein